MPTLVVRPIDAARLEASKQLDPSRKTFTKFLETLSWETGAWIVDNPIHLIHFNGARFLGPYGDI